MALDHELPVWTILPNWAEDITELLQWYTGVLGSKTGHEQRYALNLSPRRSLDATFNPTDGERTFLELSIQRLGRNEWMVPLWFHAGNLTASELAASNNLSFDTTLMEFFDGGMALLVGPNAFSCEAVRIDTVSANSVTLVDPLVNDWPAGTTIHPLRRSWIDGQNLDAITSRVGDARIRFNIDSGNDLDGGAETFVLYQSIPVITQFPNWLENLDTKFDWLDNSLDSKTGLRYVSNVADRAFQTRRYNLLLHGRQEQMELRQLLYRLQGRLKPAWIPSYNQEFVAARDSANGTQLLDIEQVGFAYVGGVNEDVAHILIGGDEIAEIDSLGGALSPDEERLVLTNPLGRDIKTGEKSSLLHLSRLDGDAVRIRHVSGSNGAAKVAMSFKEFTGGRDGTADGHHAIETAAMVSGDCGDDAVVLIQRLPYSVSFTLPPVMPIYQGYTAVDDAYAVRGKFRLQRLDGVNIEVPFSVGTIDQVVDGLVIPATLNFTKGVYDPEIEGDAIFSVTLVGTTLTVDIASDNFKLLQDYNPNPAGAYIDSFWFMLNVQGRKNSNGWIKESYVPTFGINLIDPVEAGTPPAVAPVWYEYSIPGVDDFVGMNYYFVPYLIDEIP